MRTDVEDFGGVISIEQIDHVDVKVFLQPYDVRFCPMKHLLSAVAFVIDPP